MLQTESDGQTNKQQTQSVTNTSSGNQGRPPTSTQPSIPIGR